MKSGSWAHLSVHSEYSIADGMSHIPELVAMAVKHGHKALAVTDHNSMAGVVDLYKAARNAGIEPIAGVELTITLGEDSPVKTFHITVLARNYEGYKSLVRLTSKAYEGDKKHPYLSLDDFLCEGTENLTALTGCEKGIVTFLLNKHGRERALAGMKTLARVFTHLYAECRAGADGNAQALEISEIARELGLGVVVTCGSHYQNPTDERQHKMLRSLNLRPEDTETCEGGAFVSTGEVASLWENTLEAEELWETGLESVREILDSTMLRIPSLENYSWHSPAANDNPLLLLEQRCQDKLDSVVPISDWDKYKTRLDYELSIIRTTGMAGYLDLVANYVDWCRANKIVTIARGSANGCLVAWLMGITSVDPVRWGLMVERFIDPGRVRPPDVDLDIESERRAEVVEYISTRFSIKQIGTFSTYSADSEGKGSLIVNYLGTRKGDFVPDSSNILGSIREHSSSDLEDLQRLSDAKPRRSVGVHAAGFILDSPDHRIADLIPTMVVESSGVTVTQYPMEACEDLGFIKIDLLGLRSLTVLRRCQEMLGRDDPSDLDWIPEDDKETCKALSDGVSGSGVFQLEGWTVSRGIQKMKIKKTADCITAVALFRPALIESGYDELYVTNRTREGRKTLTYPHPVFKKHLDPTFGVPLYQEQVLEVLRDLGVSPDGLNKVLKAVKGKSGGKDAQKLFDETVQHYHTLAIAAGMTREEAEEGWALIEGFVGYGFNKAHAVAYGLMAYRAGYLKTNYPIEYMCAVLESVTGRKDKETVYEKEARRIGIPILPACVNESAANWSVDKKSKSLRRGLVSLRGIGITTATEISSLAPYVSVQDLATRTSRKVTGKDEYASGEWKGTLGTLKRHGALIAVGEGI